jgi:hypothetical protein
METITKLPLPSRERLQQSLAAAAKLLDQTMTDIDMLDSELEERMIRASQESEACLEVSVAQQGELIQELERLKLAAAEWDVERDELIADCRRANELLEEKRKEQTRIQEETDEAAAIALELQVARTAERVRAEAMSRWDAERAELVNQRDRALRSLTDRDTEHHQALLLVDRLRCDLGEERDRLRQQLEHAANAYSELESDRNRLSDECERFRRLLADASMERSASSGSEKSSMAVDAVYNELERVEGLIQGISRVIEDPATELSVVIRKNSERAELESYLKGIRFRLPRAPQGVSK